MIGETREAIEAYCVAVGLVVYEWNDLHEKLARLFALVRGGAGRKHCMEWYAIRSDTRQREKLRRAIIETTSDRWKKSPRAPGDLKWLLDRVDKLTVTATTPSTRHAHSTFGETAHPGDGGNSIGERW